MGPIFSSRNIPGNTEAGVIGFSLKLSLSIASGVGLIAIGHISQNSVYYVEKAKCPSSQYVFYTLTYSWRA
jgi:hypothetical protein